MEFLLLWSGDVRGMRKARIPSIPCRGFLHRMDEEGVAVVPDSAAIGEVLPARLLPAFERAPMTEVKLPGGQSRKYQLPLMYDLCRIDGSWITRLYLQPLDAVIADKRESDAA